MFKEGTKIRKDSSSFTISMKLSNLKNKRILILGFAREGKDTLLFLKKLFPKKEIGIADQKIDKKYLQKIKDYDVIMKSPGIPPAKIKKHIKAGQKVTSQAEIFFENFPGKIVGITGTKGKSTTSALIFAILKKGGFPVKLVGNIGKPALSSLLKATPKDVFVYELSSHQLWGLKKSPHVAVFLNIYPEHLDYCGNFREYANAKANITKHQKREDYLIYNSEDRLVSGIAKKSKARKIAVQGKYYDLDINAAKAVARIFKVPESLVEKAIKEFRYLPHRLEFVGEYKGIRFYNDSLSTIPETTIAALNFLGADVQTLILGGYDRGLDFKKLAKRIEKSSVKTLIFFPETGKRISRLIDDKQNKFFVSSMKKAVELAYKNTERGKVCLLSPASPSFGLFKDYEDRGNQFKKYACPVKSLRSKFNKGKMK